MKMKMMTGIAISKVSRKIVVETNLRARCHGIETANLLPIF